jgi:hypothetical protein
VPPPDEVKVAAEALRKDAGEWDRWSRDLDQAAVVAGGLPLTTREMSLLSDLVGLPALYTEIQHLAERRAHAGASAFQAVANALRSAANHYDQADANAVSRLTPR